jgi:hypothetical protein
VSAGAAGRASLRELVDRVHDLPYGRPCERDVEGMLREGRGTCSTKHLFLARALERSFPRTRPQLIHRVYRLLAHEARRAFGEDVAALVPERGLVDVHRYLTLLAGGERVRIDVTFPWMDKWDGRSSMPLACGPGVDYPAGLDPEEEKRELEARYCEAAMREPLIEALGGVSRRAIRIGHQAEATGSKLE